MNKQIKDLTDLELGMAVAQGQQQLVGLQNQVSLLIQELSDRNKKSQEVIAEEEPKEL